MSGTKPWPWLSQLRATALVNLFARDATHRNWSGGAMILVGVVEIGLEFAEVGQHGIPVPAFGAELRPCVEVGGRAAQCHLTVDGGAAAHQLALVEEIRLASGV